MHKLNTEQLNAIKKKIEEAIEVRRARINPADGVRPVFLSCLENLTNPKLIAAIIDEPVDMVQDYISHSSEERLKGKLTLLMKRALFLPINPGLEKEFEETLMVNIDPDQPDWVSGAETLEALLEIGEALAAQEHSEDIAVICDRLSNQMSPRRMSIAYGWLETYVQEGKSFVAWFNLYKAEKRDKAERRRQGYLSGGSAFMRR
jgi:hypothetical protein